MEEVLLIDNSNTRTKFCLLSRLGENAVRSLPTQELSVASIRDAVRGWAFSRVVLCSVVPEAACKLRAAFEQPVIFLSADLAGLKVDFSHYPGRNTLGADRVANALGLAAAYPAPAVALDMGTAVTFDVVTPAPDASLCFRGGAITPGLQTLCQSLHLSTALLPSVQIRQCSPCVGQTTQEAIWGGCSIGFCAMVQGVLQQIERELGCKPFVVATGGDAAWAAPFIPEIDTVAPMLTLSGLAFFAQAL